MNKPLNKSTVLNTLALTAALGLSAGSATVFAEEMDNAMNTDSRLAPATYTNDWKTPEAIAFDKLDKTGNGLLLPHEASKGKAFNKKTFAAADANNDGYIDVNEYAFHTTGKSLDAAQSDTMGAADTSATDNMGAADNMNVADNSTGVSALTSDESLVNDEPVIIAESDTSANNAAAGETNRPVGVVIEDSVITTKAKAKILATKDLETLQISVETRQGDVTLSGTVDNEAAKMKAEQVVSEIEGVKSVRNGLEVKG